MKQYVIRRYIHKSRSAAAGAVVRYKPVKR